MRDPYLYPDVDVLINKKNIKDSKQLDKLEEDGYISGPNGSKPREVYREHLLSANENEEF